MVEKAAQLANEVGIDHIQLKTLADSLNIQPPSLYNHISAMLWYNKYQDMETQRVTERLFSICFRITTSLNISEENCNHLLRTFRAFLEGFSLLVNNNAFGHSLSVEESFDLSLKVLIAGMKELEGLPG